jgi:small conductance mechanosensitive channel
VADHDGAEVGLNLVAVTLIFFAGRIAAKILTKAAQRVIAKTESDETLSRFVGNLVCSGLLTVVILVALSKLGVQTASFIAIFGAAGLAVGMALPGSLSNFAVGVLLLVFRPISVGEYVVIAGTEGIVKHDRHLHDDY